MLRGVCPRWQMEILAVGNEWVEDENGPVRCCLDKQADTRHAPNWIRLYSPIHPSHDEKTEGGVGIIVAFNEIVVCPNEGREWAPKLSVWI